MSSEECAATNHQMLKKESAADIERSIGGKDQSREWRSGLKETDEVNEVAREHRPDESEKSAPTVPKPPETGARRSRTFERIMVGRLFLVGKNCHSIVIVIPPHVSDFSGVLKQLTAYQR
jgi:hypothetical protein